MTKIGLTNIESFVEALINETKLEIKSGKEREAVFESALTKLDTFISPLGDENNTFVEATVIANIYDDVCSYFYEDLYHQALDSL